MDKQTSRLIFPAASLILFSLLGACAPLQQNSASVSDSSFQHSVFAEQSAEEQGGEKLCRVDNGYGLEEESEAGAEAEPAEPQATVAQELADLEKLGSWEDRELGSPQYDFPVVTNKHVEYYLDFFQNRARSHFEKWLSRSNRYLPMIHEELARQGLPLDLAYLALVESGFSNTAVSSAKATGMWQFMAPTAKDYGLRVDRYVDERRDPVKATKAAVSHLKDLHNEFDSWYLAVAGYNAGIGTIRRALAKYDTRSFWELANEDCLQKETKLYVPKLLAAIIIAKNPEKYGFSREGGQPVLAYEYCDLPGAVSLRAVAKASGTDEEELVQLNRELLRGVTPPGESSYRIRVPVGKRQVVLANLERVRSIAKTDFKTHVVARGETISGIGKRYGVSTTALLKANNLRGSFLLAGERLRIPVTDTEYQLLAQATGAAASHRIAPGETLSGIAHRYGVSARDLMAMNDLENGGKIRAGQILAVPGRAGSRAADASGVPVLAASGVKVARAATSVADAPPLTAAKTVRKEERRQEAEASYVVKNGDTLWEIARRFDLSAADIRKWNRLSGDAIRPGDTLQLRAAAETGQRRDAYYDVQQGDSLITIARKHNVTPSEIRQWNNLSGDLIRPGHRLLVRM